MGIEFLVVFGNADQGPPLSLLKRYPQMKRKGLTEAQALEKVPDSARETLALPYLDEHSSSTDQRYRLFVRHGAMQAVPIGGIFSAYGFSPQTTVPWF